MLEKYSTDRGGFKGRVKGGLGGSSPLYLPKSMDTSLSPLIISRKNLERNDEEKERGRIREGKNEDDKGDDPF